MVRARALFELMASFSPIPMPRLVQWVQDVRKSLSGSHLHVLSERLCKWMSFYVDHARPLLAAAEPPGEPKTRKRRKTKVATERIGAGDIEVRATAFRVCRGENGARPRARRRVPWLRQLTDSRPVRSPALGRCSSKRRTTRLLPPASGAVWC